MIIVLSKENIELAKEEVLSLTKSKYELIDNLLIVKTNLDLKNRLGYSHAIYKFLFKSKEKDLIKNIKNYPWNKIYKKNFCVRIHNSKVYKEEQLASIIWEKLENPKVNLTQPQTKIEFFFHKDIVIGGLFLSNINKSYLKRKAHLRPSLHPTSMHPKLARACINLTGLDKGTILDPFCGSGGILIEAGLMNFKITGYDCDKEQIKRAKINLKHYKLKYDLQVKDALALDKKVDAMVTDLPYGKGSRGRNLDELYKQFLLRANNYTKTMVVIFPNYIKNIPSKWKIQNKFEIYIHKSLTRIVIKLVGR